MKMMKIKSKGNIEKLKIKTKSSVFVIYFMIIFTLLK